MRLPKYSSIRTPAALRSHGYAHTTIGSLFLFRLFDKFLFRENYEGVVRIAFFLSLNVGLYMCSIFIYQNNFMFSLEKN